MSEIRVVRKAFRNPREHLRRIRFFLVKHENSVIVIIVYALAIIGFFGVYSSGWFPEDMEWEDSKTFLNALYSGNLTAGAIVIFLYKWFGEAKEISIFSIAPKLGLIVLLFVAILSLILLAAKTSLSSWGLTFLVSSTVFGVIVSFGLILFLRFGKIKTVYP